MNLKKIIWSLIAGTSVGVGGGLLYRRGRDLRNRRREQNEWMQQVLSASLFKLSEVTEGEVSASEIYYFIWILERVCSRHRVDFPDFKFRVDRSLLFSSRLTLLLRRMLRDGRLRLVGDKLQPTPANAAESIDRLEPTLAAIIDETARQWLHDFPDEPLVRFGRLFR